MDGEFNESSEQIKQTYIYKFQQLHRTAVRSIFKEGYELLIYFTII